MKNDECHATPRTLRRLISTSALLAGLLVGVPAAWAADPDADGVDSATDNCPATFNPLQADCNSDGIGDACNLSGPAGADGDRDGVCDAVDNCAAVPNIDQGDCNHNLVGDMCEAATSNRDDDRDGVCNAVDSCPLEAAGACAMQAIAVPWVPANVSIPHPTYSGAVHTLKGIARYGGNQFMWDFGDGSAPTAWTAISNPYNLGVNHTYVGAVGQVFIATLSVRSSATPAVVATAIYRVKIGDSGALPAAAPYAMDPNKMDVRIDMAIDQGLWYLHTNMSRAQYADGAPGYAQPYGLWAGNLAGTCTALDAFLLHGSKPNKDYTTDPYVETAQRALNYVLGGNTSTATISTQVHAGVTDRPDYNLNGVGVLFGPNDTYVNGICGVAIASAGTPTRQSLVGANNNIRGRTYKDLAQDMAEWFAFGQADSGVHRGGWHYSANQQSADGSTNQWPMLAIAAAEDNMAITTPRFVRTEAPFFMAYTRHAGLDSLNGGWGYESNSDAYVNHVKTAAGMLYHYFEGNSTSHPEVKAALGFFYRNWSLNNYGAGGAWNVGIGNSYAMYGIMKAMRKPQPNILRVTEYNYNTGSQTANSFDWYYTPPGQTQVGLATDLVRRQTASGMWSDTFGNNAQTGAFATGWDVLILSKGVTTIPPEAEICDCTLTWDNDQNVVLDGSCSTHPDLNRHIVAYEWDFHYGNNTFDVEGTGAHGTLVGGYQSYGPHPVALRVTDDNPVALGGPQTSIATCSITTKPPNNCPHPSAGGPYLATHDVPFALDATASSDPDGDDLTFAWDLDNDGQFDDAVGATPSVSFATTGTFSIAVLVTDVRAPDPLAGPCGRVAYSTVEVGNHAPVADPGGPYTARPGQTLMLDGTGSSDPDGDMITFGWDLNNDGLFSDSAAITPVFTVPANAAVGTVYGVCLKVTDELGRVSEPRCTTVTVAHVNTPPTCALPLPAVVAQCTGGPIDVTVDGSLAQDADGDPLTFAWTTSCPDGSFADPGAAMTTLTLSSAGAACAVGCVATLTVSDGAAQATCARAINVVDTVDPAFTRAPDDLALECDSGAAAAVDAWLTSATGADACTATTVANDFVEVAGGCGGATGTTTVTWSATDACGNVDQVSASLAVVDTLAPAVTCPAPTTTECTAPATAVNLGALATDGCFGALPTSGPTAGLYPVGTTAVTFTAADACGNQGGCSSSVTVTDTTPPDLACPSPTTAQCNAPRSATGVDGGAATAADLCGPASTSSDAPASGTYPLGATTTTFEATDGHGNVDSCTSTVTVIDSIAPALVCPADVVAECNAPGVAIGVRAGAATATEICTTATVTDPAPANYPLGQTTVTHGAVDEAGNAASCTNVVVVQDTTGPTFDPASLGPRTVLGTCGGGAVTFAAPTATDVCQAVTVTCQPLAGTSVGANTVTCTATDGSGNATTATITVNVLAPLRLVFQSPLEDDNQADDPSTDADVANVFKVGSTVPHQVKVMACSGADVTSTIGGQVTLRLTETYRAGAGGGQVAIVPEYNGQGDAGGVLVLAGSHFKYNLSTDASHYPAGTQNNAAYFSSLVTATYDVAPAIIAGREDARLESR